MSYTTEKDTDRLFNNYWESIFNEPYNTKTNKKLFNSLIPDGWKIINNTLFIIENKRDYKHKHKAKLQLQKYIDIIYDNNKFNEFDIIYLIFGYGDSQLNFNYHIYKYSNNKIIKTKYKLETIKEQMNLKDEFDEREIHKFNQYLYNTIQDFSKSEKTLFVASILLTLKIDSNFVKDYNIDKPGFIIANKMLELIQNEYNDETFTSKFNFLKRTLNNRYLYDLINKITIDVKKYSKDILNKFYSEFCKWDKNSDSENGVVLTPHDIVEMMIKELDIKENDYVLDFCTGTGSFLLEAGKYTTNLIGCECNNERYALCKCNFILNDYAYNNLFYNNCFNQKFSKVDKSIINPPFSCNSPDEDVEENITNWKSYKKEQKFLLYQVQCLKENGIGAAIIPRGNFNNNSTKKFKKELMKHIQILKIINCNKNVFSPEASPECAIIIYKRTATYDKPNISKNVKIIDYTNDGYSIIQKLRVKTKEPEIKEQIRDLTYEDDWNYQIDLSNDIDIKLLLRNEKLESFYKNTINNKYSVIVNLISDLEKDINYIENLQIKRYELYKIGDYFELAKPSKTFTIKNSIEGKYPLITRSSINNGISKYINDYSFDGEYITIAPSGSVGSCFYHSGKFAVDGPIKTFKPKENNKIDLHIWSLCINNYLTKKYSYTNGLTIEKILNEKINIPIFE